MKILVNDFDGISDGFEKLYLCTSKTDWNKLMIICLLSFYMVHFALVFKSHFGFLDFLSLFCSFALIVDSDATNTNTNGYLAIHRRVSRKGKLSLTLEDLICKD